MVIDPGESDFKEGQLLTEAEYREAEIEFPFGLKTMVGSEAVMELLKNLDLDALAIKLQEDLLKTASGPTTITERPE